MTLFSNIKGDTYGALAAAIITLPMCIGYGIIVFAPLGTQYAPRAAMTGVYSAVFAGFLAAFFGGNPIQITGPKALLMFVQASFVSTVAASPHIPETGDEKYLIVVGLASVTVLIAGLFQIIFAALRFGNVTKYVPHPVIAGFTNGIAVLLIAAQISPILGTKGSFSLSGLVHQLESIQNTTLAVGLFTLFVLLLSKRWVKSVPDSLTGLLAGTCLYYIFSAYVPDAASVPLIGIIRFEWPLPDIFLHLFYLKSFETLRIFLPDLLITGWVIGLLSAMETLLSSVTSDNLTGNRHNSMRELVGQGIGNIVTSFFGSLPAGGSVPRTMANFKAGGRTPLSGMLCGIFIFLIMMLLGPWVGKVPLTVIAGILIAVGFTLFDKWTIAFLRKRHNPLKQPKEVLINLVVTLTVTIATISVNMIAAVGIGMAFASALFVSKMGKSVIRRKYLGSQFHSKKMRSPEHGDILEKEGWKIVVFELQGPIFFGSAENLAKEVEDAMKEGVYCILDMKRVNEIDSTGANILLQISKSIEKQGKFLLITYLKENRSLWEFLQVMDVVRMLGREMFLPDTDRALEWTEEHLLADGTCRDAYMNSFFFKMPVRRLPRMPGNHFLKQYKAQIADLSLSDKRLTEMQTPADLPFRGHCDELVPEQMNIVKGFTPRELEDFKEKLIRQIYKKGQAVFREGDPGKDLFLLTKGSVTVKIRLPGADRFKRLFTFMPGVVFGEVALLDGKPRSADVWAEEDSEVYRLSLDDFDVLRREKPEIVIKLLLNIAKEFSRNLRRISNEVRALEDT